MLVSDAEARRLSAIRVYKAEDLVSYRDPRQFSDVDYAHEQQRVYDAVAIEREWMAGLIPFDTDHAIQEAFERGELAEIKATIGIMPIRRLMEYGPDRADPTHELHYSPPYLRPMAWEVLQFVGAAWSRIQMDERDEPFAFLPVTSATRSTAYQTELTSRPGRKIAIDTKTKKADHSGHEYGYDFDIDGGGIYLYDPLQRHLKSVNPRESDFNNYAQFVAYGRNDLQEILNFLQSKNIINYVEEVPGTKEWCFHVSVNPTLSNLQAAIAL